MMNDANSDLARATLLAAAQLCTPTPSDPAERATKWWPMVLSLALELDNQTRALQTAQTKNVSAATFTGIVTAVRRHRSGRALITITPDLAIRSGTDYGYSDFLNSPAGLNLCLTAAAAAGQHVRYGKRRATKQSAGNTTHTRPDGTAETTPRIDWIQHLDGSPITQPTTAETLLRQSEILGIENAIIGTLSDKLLPPLQPTQRRTVEQCASLWAALIPDHLPMTTTR
jgi:hypothetical protein